MSGVISEARVPGNDGFKLYSVVCGRRSPAGLALRRVLRQAEAPPLRPENFFALLREITYNKSCEKKGDMPCENPLLSPSPGGRPAHQPGGLFQNPASEGRVRGLRGGLRQRRRGAGRLGREYPRTM